VVDLGRVGSLRVSARRSLGSESREHFAGDFRCAYALLVQQWLDYLRFIKTTYPYLFLLAVRTNPFDADATPVVGS